MRDTIHHVVLKQNINRFHRWDTFVLLVNLSLVPHTFFFVFLLIIKTKNVRMESKQKVLKWNWSDFHLSLLDRIVVSFPVIPVDSICIGWVRPMMIQSIQVRGVTTPVPPSSFEVRSTVNTWAVIVLIFGWKWIVSWKRTASSTWKKSQKVCFKT